MFKLTEGAAHVVAADSRTAIEDFDAAFISGMRLATNAIEGIKGAGVPAGQSQRLYKKLVESFGQLVEGRATLISAIGHLQIIHQKSNIAETDLGCPWLMGTDAPTASASMQLDRMPATQAN
ncbi:MAG: hypothetical protein ABW184_05650 [Sphingobium sp.]